MRRRSFVVKTQSLYELDPASYPAVRTVAGSAEMCEGGVRKIKPFNFEMHAIICVCNMRGWDMQFYVNKNYLHGCVGSNSFWHRELLGAWEVVSRIYSS